MALDTKIFGTSTAAEVTTGGFLRVQQETDVATYPERIGAVRHFGSNDDGDITGIVRLRSPEVDVDYRERQSLDMLLEEEIHNYTAQNTGKTIYSKA